ncbi:MAG: RibD family protein [Coleofasciculaceae cyanobacterium]
MLNRPHTTVVLAMSADGKIADVTHSPARFSTVADLAHLERQVAAADAVLFGAGTLRAYGTTISVTNPQLLQMRLQRGMSLQPAQIVCSRQVDFDPQLRFFKQQIPRWLLTTTVGLGQLQKLSLVGSFERILVAKTEKAGLDWFDAFVQLRQLGIEDLAILGGGSIVASLLAVDLIDELWLTVCPLILGGTAAPTPVDGEGFPWQVAPLLELVEVQTIEQEVFLHYRRQRS